MLLLITLLPRARDQGSATAASLVTSNPLGGKPKGLFCRQPSTLAKSKASCLKLDTDFYILICSLEQEYKKICRILVAAVALEVSLVKHLLKKETSLLPVLSTSYSLFPSNWLPMQTDSSRSLKKVRSLAGRDEARTTSLSRGEIQNLGQRTFRGQRRIRLRSSCNTGRCDMHRDTWD